MILTIQHIGDTEDGPLFTLSNGEMTTNPVPLPEPASIPVEGFEKETLPAHLRWYLEDYLEVPHGPNIRRAEATVAALESWGTQVFDALFDRDSYRWYAALRDENRIGELQLRIVSRSPDILAWPWEALCDNRRPGARRGYFLAPHCCVERLPEPRFEPEVRAGETETLRMLLVIARPFGDRDVNYHAVSRAVVDYVRDHAPGVEIDVLRPPTFESLQRALREKRYHIVHFDGHGGYGEPAELGRTDEVFAGAEGCLAFETEPHPGEAVQPRLVGARELGQVLFDCGVPMVVLNACQSAMIDENAESAYASVAASLLDAGVRSVTAMGYSLYVSGAREFVPAYYRELFCSGSPAAAMREGRMAMLLHPERPSALGPVRLRDWLVPVLYQRLNAAARLLPSPTGTVQPVAARVYPPEALEPKGGMFIGRGQAILVLERLVQRRRAAGVLIHGMAGAGKTALARGFLRWLRDTGGLRQPDGSPCPVLWFDFREVHSAAYVVHELAALLCEGGASQKEEETLDRVVNLLRTRRACLVWDNFESTGGPEANLTEEERQKLLAFLEKLRGGESRVLLTSRTTEPWLPERVCARMEALDGLRGEELWAFCARLAEDEGLTLDREDTALRALLDRLDGNPLSLRAVLPLLKERSAAALLGELDAAFRGAAGDESTRRIRAAFALLLRTADVALDPVLQLLGLHEQYADAEIVVNTLGNMAQLEPETPEAAALVARVARCFALLERAGLCERASGNLYRLHPALRSCLAEARPAPEPLQGWFVRVLNYYEAQNHENPETRRGFCAVHGANLRRAHALAAALALQEEELGLLAALAIDADDRGDYGQAEMLYRLLAERARICGDLQEENRACGQLSVLASRRGDKAAADHWAELAVKVWERAETPSVDALYSEGMLAFRQGDYARARALCERAAALWEKAGDPRAIGLYGALGNLAVLMDDREAERRWTQKYWDAAEARGDVSFMASASRSLATLAEGEGRLPDAESWYLRSLGFFERLRDERGIMQTRWSLGDLYMKMARPSEARKELDAALLLAKKRRLKPDEADCCRSLGELALRTGSFTEARGWLEESRRLCLETDDELRLSAVEKLLQALAEQERGG